MKKYTGLFLILVVAIVTFIAKECMTKTPPTLIKYEYDKGEITRVCDEAETALKTKLDEYLKTAPEKRNFENTVQELEHLTAEYSDLMGSPTFMAYVHGDKEIRDESFACEEKMSKFMIELSLRKDIYHAFEQFRKNKNDDFSELSAADQRLIEITIRDYKKSGISLEGKKFEELKMLKKKLTELETEHAKNLVEDKSSVTVTQEELKGTTEKLQKSLKTTSDGKYIVKARGSTFFQFMQDAESEDARKRLWIAYVKRATPRNTALLEKAIKIRHQLKDLLGYDNWVDYRTDGRMAKKAEHVSAFLLELRQKLAKKNNEQFAVLKEMKKKDSQIPFAQWDRMYYSNKLKREKYAVDSKEVRKYFPSQRVVEGTFKIYSKLLGLEFKEVKNADVWHKSVKLFEIRDKKTGELIGHFFADLYPRDGKYSHAAAFTLKKGRTLRDGTYGKTISSIVANLNPPSKEKPSLMTHDEVETFFHEFGHIMHQTLTTAKHGTFSGTSVARDYVEAPSQMLENWVWNAEMLDLISGHYEDETQKLPADLRDRLLALSHFNNGIRYTRQVYYASLDYALHTSGPNVDAIKLADDLRMEIIGIPNPENTSWVAGFGHLMGGYDAAYYGYMWSEVYAQDMFTLFAKNGLLNEETGMRYRKLILERGAAKEEMELLKDFLGREPNKEAFYRKLGIN